MQDFMEEFILFIFIFKERCLSENAHFFYMSFV